MATRFLRFTVYDVKNLTDPNVTVYKLNAIMSCGLRQNKCTCSYIPTTILISHSGNRIELFLRHIRRQTFRDNGMSYSNLLA